MWEKNIDFTAVLLLLCCWMLAPMTWASQDRCPPTIPLVDTVSVWVDESATAAYSTAKLASFVPINDRFSYGSTQSAVWLKLDLSLPRVCVGDSQHWLLRLNVPYHDQIDAYWLEQGTPRHWQGGDQRPSPDRMLYERLPSIPLQLSSIESPVFIRIASQNALNVSMNLLSPEAYAHHEQQMLLVSSLVGALILVSLLLAFLNLVLFKAIGFLYYIGFTLSITLLMMFVHGWLGVFLPVQFGDVIGTLVQAVALVFFLLLSDSLMKLSRHYPKQFYAQLFVAGLLLCWAVFAVIVGEYRWSLPLTHAVDFIMMIIMLLSAVVLWRQEPLAKVYIAVFSVTVVALMIRIGVIYGYLPMNFWTDNSMSLAFTLQVVMFLMVILMQNYQERTQHLELEFKAKQASEEVDKRRIFMSLLSHELMTPLAILDASVRNIQEDWDELDDAQRRQLDKQRKSVKRMRQIVDMCLARNYWESQAKQGCFDLPSFAQQAQQDMNELFDPQRLRWSIAVDDTQCQGRVLGSQEPLIMALSLIVHNAMKYSQQPCDISFLCRDAMLELSVRDYGIGFDQRLLTPQPFERGENVGNTQGLGLGLTIVHELVQGYAGQLHISRLEMGSCVGVTIPLTQA